MFTEILKIKPKLDETSSKQAENSLNKRFGRVSKRFGNGLKNAIKGNILFMTLGMITAMLNPLKDVEERFKALMGEGNDLRESADQAGTTPQKMNILRGTAYTVGNISADKLDSMIASFRSAVEKAEEETKENARTGAKISEASTFVKDWIGETDMAEAFSEFIQSLKKLDGIASGKGFALQEDLKLREIIETAILGGAQRGNAKRFIDADFGEAYNILGQSSGGINKATENINKQAVTDRLMEVYRKNESYTGMSKQLTPSRVLDMQERAEVEDKKALDQASMYENLSSMASGLKEIVDIISIIKDAMFTGFGYLGEMLKIMRVSRGIRGVLGMENK